MSPIEDERPSELMEVVERPSEPEELIKEQWQERLKWWFFAKAFWKQRSQIVANPCVAWSSEAERGAKWMPPHAFIVQALVIVSLAVQGITVAIHKVAKSPEHTILTWIDQSDKEQIIASIKQPVGESPRETQIKLVERDIDTLDNYIRKAEFSPAQQKFKEPSPYSDKYRISPGTYDSDVLFTLGNAVALGSPKISKDEAIKKAKSEIGKLEIVKRAFKIEDVTQDVAKECGPVIGAFSVMLAAYCFAWLYRKHANTGQTSDRVRTFFMYSSAAEFFCVNVCLSLFGAIQTLVGWYLEKPPLWLHVTLSVIACGLCGWLLLVLIQMARKWETVLHVKPPQRWFQAYTGRRQIFWDFIISSTAGTFVCFFALLIPVGIIFAYCTISIQTATQ